MESEIWKPIPGYEGFYEVSSWGNGRSLTRSVPYGRHPGMTYKGRPLKQFMAGSYLAFKLSVAGKRRSVYTHHLVLLAFEGERPVGMREIRHLDGDKLNNDLSNLAYGTTSQNAADRKIHQTGMVASK
jgi:hypothetical protein